MIRLNIRKKLNLPGGKADIYIDTELQIGSLTALYGSSGAGKTSVLKMIAGLMQPDEGMIEVNGAVWFNSRRKINRSPQRRNTGFLFQDYALFPNMTVQQNIAFAGGKDTSKADVQDLIQLMQLENLAHQKPALLSGGQQQRVALARAIIRKPEILLLDEPLSAIDHELRVELRNQIAALQRQYGFTTLLVSHEMSEIYQLADRILHLEQGKIIADETPQRLFNGSADLLLTAELVRLTTEGAEIMVNNQFIKLPLSAVDIIDPMPGQKVTLKCSASGMRVQKLS